MDNPFFTFMMISDETGEGKITVHQILLGIMICFTDMHMEQCMSEFELNSGQKDGKDPCDP